MTGSIRAAALGGILLTIVLSGCALPAGIGMHQQEQVFDDLPAARSSAQAALLPDDLIPADATEVRIRWIKDAPGRLVRFTSATGPDESQCAAASLTGRPALDASWWPEEIPAEGEVCGGWQVFELDGVTYGWTA